VQVKRGEMLYRRRTVITSMLGTSLLAASSLRVSAQGASIQEESQSGDPGAPVENVAVNESEIEDLLRIVAFNHKKDAKELSLKTLSIASSFAGQDKWHNPQMVRDFFYAFGMDAGEKPQSFLAFCAAGLCFCASKAYCEINPYPVEPGLDNIKEAMSDINKFFFRPNPLVRVMQKDADLRGKWIPQSNISPNLLQAGWPIIFSWAHDGVANHIGLVEAQDGNEVATIEFNTRVGNNGDPSTGGHVAKKRRSMDDVLGVIRVY
jgi:hypothetical protein